MERYSRQKSICSIEYNCANCRLLDNSSISCQSVSVHAVCFTSVKMLWYIVPCVFHDTVIECVEVHVRGALFNECQTGLIKRLPRPNLVRVWS